MNCRNRNLIFVYENTLEARWEEVENCQSEK